MSDWGSSRVNTFIYLVSNDVAVDKEASILGYASPQVAPTRLAVPHCVIYLALYMEHQC